jgi:hypothetical protein
LNFLISSGDVETFSTQGNIAFSSSDEFNVGADDSSECVGGIGIAVPADGLEFLDFLCERDELDDGFEASSQESSVERGNNNYFAHVCGILREIYDL